MSAPPSTTIDALLIHADPPGIFCPPALSKDRDGDQRLLQIYPGRAMTCVFDQAKALCQLRNAEGQPNPDQDDCHSTCRNLAYTDRDIAALRQQATELETPLGDFLAPSPRYQRTRAELDRIHTLIYNHTRNP